MSPDAKAGSAAQNTNLKTEAEGTAAVNHKQTTQHLGVLEEDDEFEEFEVADWDDTQTDLAHLAGAAAPGAARSSGDKLWEDNWDDDDIEEEFSMQLRSELLKRNKTTGADGGGDPMEQ